MRVRFRCKQKDCTINKDFFITIKPKPNKAKKITFKDDIRAIATS